VILLVANVNKPKCISANAPRVVKLPVCGSLTAECSQKMTTGVKYLDPVIISVGDDKLSDSVDSHSRQTIKLSLPVAISSDPKSVLTLLIKDLDPVIG
jgi:hypothetical protein